METGAETPLETSPEPAPEAEIATAKDADVEAPSETTVPTSPATPPATPTVAQPLTTSEERTWAMLAQLSVLLNLITGIFGPVVALIIYLVFKDRSRYVAYQSMQSVIFQLVWWVGSGILIGAIWLITGLTSLLLFGLLLIPFAILATIILGLLPLASLVYGVVAAIECNQGRDFRYWLVGDWVRSIYEG
jgi:uncharacterized Tic20 family protein